MLNDLFADRTYFQLEQVAEGVYFAQSLPGTGTLGNAAFVDLGDCTLIFDTFLTPQAALALRQAAEQLTGRPVRYVINSHYHADHVMGNQVFLPDATFIATSRTRELIAATKFLDQLGEVAGELDQMEQELLRTEDEVKRRELRSTISDNRALLAAAPTLQAILPTLTFDERLVFHGSRRSAELLTYGGGHTGSDAFLYLPAEHLALMGDLVLVGCQPMFVQGDPQAWSAILDRVRLLDIQTIVPGHGPVGTMQDLDLVQRYLTTIEELARSAFEQGKTLAEASQTPLPEPFASWNFRETFGWNMETFFTRWQKVAEGIPTINA